VKTGKNKEKSLGRDRSGNRPGIKGCIAILCIFAGSETLNPGIYG
jgi:hypothetical protein